MLVDFYKDGNIILTTDAEMVTSDMFDVANYALLNHVRHTNEDSFDEHYEQLCMAHQWKDRNEPIVKAEYPGYGHVHTIKDRVLSVEEVKALHESFNEPKAVLDEGRLDSITQAVKANHYSNYIDDMEWIEAISKIPFYRSNPERFKGALQLMVRKYLDRLGQRDSNLQEMMKARRWLDFAISFEKHGCLNFENLE